MRRIIGLCSAALVLSATLAFAAACDSGSSSDKGKLSVVASLELFADMARHVVGDRAEVEALLPPGADPHTYELSPARVADIARADVVFVNGLHLEGNVVDAIETNAEGPVVELSRGLPVLEGDDQEDAKGNPHMWLDVTRAETYVEHIRDALIGIDPEGRATYEANAAAYLQELTALDLSFEAAVQAIPEENRKLVTFHDAYPYLAQRYGLAIVAVVVPSPGQEPSAQDVADLTDKLKTEHVPAVFREPQFNSEILEQAAREAGVEVRELLSDAYAEDVDSYVGLMEFNMRQLQEGLGGG
ncbi:MAG: metal ABC transporter substrate-binding protein [Dehalococcoidia bacterium]